MSPILKALKKITGEEFVSSKDLVRWVSKNVDKLKEMAEDCEAKEKAQRELAKERR